MMKAPAIGVLCLLFLLGACPKAPGEDALDAGADRRDLCCQGTWDYTVRETNGDQLAKQWTGAQGIAFTKSSTTTVAPGVTRRVWPATGGAVELWKIADMGHVVPVMNGCGTSGPYFSAEKVCATEEMASFFGLLQDGWPSVVFCARV